MKLVPPKNRTKIACFTSNFFCYTKFSGRWSRSWVFKFFLDILRYLTMNFPNLQLPRSILSTLSEFLKIKKGGQFFNILCAGIRIVQLRPRTESRDRLSTNQERCPQGSRLPGLIVILDVGLTKKIAFSLLMTTQDYSLFLAGNQLYER